MFSFVIVTEEHHGFTPGTLCFSTEPSGYHVWSDGPRSDSNPRVGDPDRAASKGAGNGAAPDEDSPVGGRHAPAPPAPPAEAEH